MTTAEALPKPAKTRDEAAEFARRTWKNYLFVKRAQAFHAGDEQHVHVVVHLANSLLGLVVYPWEKDFVEPVAELDLKGLIEDGWPSWTFDLGGKETKTVGDLIHHLRNAVAHRLIGFSSDSPTLREVTVTFADRKGRKAAPHWRARINGEDLEVFCERFAEALSNID